MVNLKKYPLILSYCTEITQIKNLADVDRLRNATTTSLITDNDSH